ncbi:hypothetical protein [Sphaerimonospora thailandensis]|nr:hypothetical protein [Sphaerimonospora thailandensis]
MTAPPLLNGDTRALEVIAVRELLKQLDLADAILALSAPSYQWFPHISQIWLIEPILHHSATDLMVMHEICNQNAPTWFDHLVGQGDRFDGERASFLDHIPLARHNQVEG